VSDPGGPARYEIRVDGVLDNKWADWFGGLQVSSDGTQTAISGLLADQPALHGALSRHLAHEERETLPLLSRTLTRAEWHGFVADQQRKSGIRGAAQLFPWLLDEASPEQAQAVLAQLPAPLRVANRRIWRPRYARHAHWEPAASVPRALAPAPPSEPSVTSPAGDAVPRDGSRAGRPHGALERALEYARHGRSIGG